MQKPPVPFFEKERQDALTLYQIMDTEKEREYDEIAELASFICGTPVSLITFIDEDRQWFKAAVGTEFTENTRKDSFCTYVLPEPDELLLVPDARKDVRFRENPLVVNTPNVNFYAGVALKSREGLPIGTLCVLDVKPNQLNEQQQKALRTLADQTSKLLELRRKNFETKKAAEINQAILQAKIDEQVAELKVKNSRLLRATEEIKRMFYVASHDLKEPVRKLKIYTDLLRGSQQNSKRNEEFIEKINSHADHIGDLIKDIGIFSEVNLNDADSQTVNLNDLAEEVLRRHEQQISESGALINVSDLPMLEGSYRQLYQLFANLLTNALKYADGKPIIEWSFETVNGEDVITDAGHLPSGLYYRIDFKDHGIGIEEAYSKKIFDFFSRLHSRQEFEGNGIGLAIVKKVALNHNGWVTATSIPGQGATFRIYLPKYEVLV